MPPTNVKKTTSGRLEEELRNKIVSGELKAGDQLPAESELSTHYGVSRNTAREAIRGLASQGLLTLKRGIRGGTFVSVPTTQQVSVSLRTGLDLLTNCRQLSVAALVEVREMLEVPAAELAALRRTDDDLAAIRLALFNPDDIDLTEIFSDTRDFHMAILKATGNPLLEIVAEPVFRILNERFLRERAPLRMWKEIDREHREILTCLEARDQVGAREATRAHLRTVKKLYEGIDEASPRANLRKKPKKRVDIKTSKV